MRIPLTEQQQRLVWNEILLDIEYRSEQLRQLKSLEPLKLAISAAGTAAGVLAAIAGGTVWLLHSIGWLH